MLKKLLSYIIPINLYKANSEVSKSIEVTLYNGEIVVDAQNVNYSYGSLQRVLRFGLKKISFQRVKQMNNILVLGVAGGSVVKTLVNEINYQGYIKGVELDNQIIEVANKYFGLDKTPNFQIIIDDAEEFVKKEKQKYDLIIVDIFKDREMPDFLFEESFINNLISLLDKRGMILFNTMKTNKMEAERNEKYKLNFSHINFDVSVFSEVEKYNELIIIEKKD